MKLSRIFILERYDRNRDTVQGHRQHLRTGDAMLQKIEANWIFVWKIKVLSQDSFKSVGAKPAFLKIYRCSCTHCTQTNEGPVVCFSCVCMNEMCNLQQRDSASIKHFSLAIFTSLERPNISQICSIYKATYVEIFCSERLHSH